MTSEAQRIAIAEVCGWRHVHPSARYELSDYAVDQGRLIGDKPGQFWDFVPDYLNDLNAMHEAEKILDDGVLWKGYLNRLWDVVCPQFQQMSGLNAAVGLLLVHATAGQRAEAFLRTLNLWDDSK